MFATSVSSATSQRIASARWPPVANSPATARTAFSSISAITTAAPASAKALAVARPMTWLAPVTSAPWPSKFPFIELLLQERAEPYPCLVSQFLPRRPEQDFVYVHIVRLLDREGDGAREGVGGDREINSRNIAACRWPIAGR